MEGRVLATVIVLGTVISALVMVYQYRHRQFHPQSREMGTSLPLA